MNFLISSKVFKDDVRVSREKSEFKSNHRNGMSEGTAEKHSTNWVGKKEVPIVDILILVIPKLCVNEQHSKKKSEKIFPCKILSFAQFSYLFNTLRLCPDSTFFLDRSSLNSVKITLLIKSTHFVLQMDKFFAIFSLFLGTLLSMLCGYLFGSTT